jgi:hypothetical protein
MTHCPFRKVTSRVPSSTSRGTEMSGHVTPGTMSTSLSSMRSPSGDVSVCSPLHTAGSKSPLADLMAMELWANGMWLVTIRSSGKMCSSAPLSKIPSGGLVSRSSMAAAALNIIGTAASADTETLYAEGGLSSPYLFLRWALVQVAEVWSMPPHLVPSLSLRPHGCLHSVDLCPSRLQL